MMAPHPYQQVQSHHLQQQDHDQQQLHHHGGQLAPPSLDFFIAASQAPAEQPPYAYSFQNLTPSYSQALPHLQIHAPAPLPVLISLQGSSGQVATVAQPPPAPSLATRGIPFHTTLAERRGHAPLPPPSPAPYGHGADAGGLSASSTAASSSAASLLSTGVHQFHSQQQQGPQSQQQQAQRSPYTPNTPLTATAPTSSAFKGSKGKNGTEGSGRGDARNGSQSIAGSPTLVDWSQEEDERLRTAIAILNKANASTGGSTNITASNSKSWIKIASIAFPDGCRSKEECINRWRALTKPPSIKGPWSQTEDETLQHLVDELGPEKWVAIAQRLGTRSGKQCRERWHNHINPDIRKGPFTPEEDSLILRLFTDVGSKWAYIAKYMPGRTDNAIKNHYNTVLVRRAKLIAAVTNLKDKGLDVPVALQMQADQLGAQQRQQQPKTLLVPTEGTTGTASSSSSAALTGSSAVAANTKGITKKSPAAKQAGNAPKRANKANISSGSTGNNNSSSKPPSIHVVDSCSSAPSSAEDFNNAADDSALFFGISNMQVPMSMPMSMSMPMAGAHVFVPNAPASAPPTVTSFGQAVHGHGHGPRLFHANLEAQAYHQLSHGQQHQQEQQQQQQRQQQQMQHQRQLHMQIQMQQQQQLEAAHVAAAAGFLDANFDMHDESHAATDPYAFMTASSSSQGHAHGHGQEHLQHPPPPAPAPVPGLSHIPQGHALARSASLSVPGPHANLNLALNLDVDMHSGLLGPHHAHPHSPDSNAFAAAGASGANHNGLLPAQQQQQQPQQAQLQHQFHQGQQQQQQQQSNLQSLSGVNTGHWTDNAAASYITSMRPSSAPAYGATAGAVEDVFGSHPILVGGNRNSAVNGNGNGATVGPAYAFQLGDLSTLGGALGGRFAGVQNSDVPHGSKNSAPPPQPPTASAPASVEASSSSSNISQSQQSALEAGKTSGAPAQPDSAPAPAVQAPQLGSIPSKRSSAMVTSSPIATRARSRSLLSPVQATPRRHAAVSFTSALRSRSSSGNIHNTPRPSLPTPSRISPISSYQAKTGSVRALPPLDPDTLHGASTSGGGSGGSSSSSISSSPQVMLRGHMRGESFAASSKLLSTALASSDGMEAGIANSALAMRGVDEEQKGALLPAFSHQSQPSSISATQSLSANLTRTTTASTATATTTATPSSEPESRGKKRAAEQDLGPARAQGRLRSAAGDSSERELAPASASTVASTLIPSPRDEQIDLSPYTAIGPELDGWDPSKWNGGDDHSRLLSESWWESLKNDGGLGLSFQPNYSNYTGLHSRALSAVRESPRAIKDTP